MKISRRNFCLLMAGACCTGVLAACGSSSSSTASSSAASASAAASGEVRDELIFVNYRDIRDLNPHLYAGEMYAQSILYDTLVSITADGYEGCLAESWDISEDGCTYTFHIRPNVLFSDGEKCDANAILANFNAILENRERHTWLEMMNLLVGVGEHAGGYGNREALRMGLAQTGVTLLILLVEVAWWKGIGLLG